MKEIMTTMKKNPSKTPWMNGIKAQWKPKGSSTVNAIAIDGMNERQMSAALCYLTGCISVLIKPNAKITADNLAEIFNKAVEYGKTK